MKKINKLIGLGIITLMASCNQKEAIDPIWMGKIEREDISVVTKVPGKVEKILVEEGQIVHKGDTLLILEMPEVGAKQEQAQGALDAASAQYEMARKGATSGQIKQLEAKVNGLKQQFDFAQKSLDRLTELLQDSLVPQQQYDEVYAKYIGAQNQYIAAETQLVEAREGARQEQQLMALGQKGRAQGAMSEVEIASKERYVIAPQDMSIENINLKIGELALPGYPIVGGYLNESTYFRFTIPENQMGEITKGKKVSVSVPYKEDMKVEGKVTLIKALSSYANIATAYPDFDNQQALFEVKVMPTDHTQVNDLITKASVSLELE